jgi:tRNA (guanine-N7-)-methyltransferase
MFLGSIALKNAYSPVASRSFVGFLGTVTAFSTSPLSKRKASTTSSSALLSSPLSSPRIQEESHNENPKNNHQFDDCGEGKFTPWNNQYLSERAKTAKAFRSRQHVNPLSSKFQQPTVLSKDWPRDVFQDFSLPLFLDIGCSRGGFLLQVATQRPNDYNYLGLEIRPVVAQHAKDRLFKRPHVQGHLDFVGCNANVDLERLLTLWTKTKAAETNKASSDNSPADSLLQQQSCDLQMVCIQFPDPHFKARHAKRRVVMPELVETLACFMPPGGTVFLQSDIQSVLDEMRLQFREQSQYFVDSRESLDDYLEDNILGIPTEREVSVLEKGLPVYRATFTRTNYAVIREHT